MITFKKFLTEVNKAKVKTTKPVVFAFGRMNPPTVGHEVLVNKVKDIAKEQDAHHEIVLSHSQDPKKNPLSPEQKLTHARRMFPGTNLSVATSKEPTLLHHLQRLHQAGHDEVTVVAGEDRVPEYTHLINHYNSTPTKDGKQLFAFKRVNVVSAGARDPDAEGVEGMSASKMRAAASAGQRETFHSGLPKRLSTEHKDALYNDIRAGMGVKE